MSEGERQGLEAAIEFERLQSLEWEKKEAYSAYCHASTRLELLNLKVDIQRDRMGLDAVPNQKYLREWRKH